MYSLPFFYFSLSLIPCSLFSFLFRDRRPLPPSQALSPFLSHSVLRNTHATSTLKRARALHPLHRDVLSKIQPLFQPGRPMGRTRLPLYPPVAAHIAVFVIRHSAGSKFHSFPFTVFLSRTISLSSGHFRRALAQMFSLCGTRGSGTPLRSVASLGFLAAPLLVSSSSSSRNIPADITALFQFRPNFPECCQLLSAVVVHNITFAVLKGSRYS